MTEIRESILPSDDRGNDPCDHRMDVGYTYRVLASTRRIPGDTEPTAPVLRVVPAALSAPIPPLRYVVEHILPSGHVTLLGGHGGSGKSLLALIIAAHCAVGRSWAGLPVIQCRALIVTLEDPANLVRLRLRRIVAHYDLPADTVEAGITIVDGSDGVCLAHETAGYGAARRLTLTAAYDELHELSAGHGLILIDNASDAYAASENDRQLVRAFMAALARLARDLDAAVMLLAHVDKMAARYGANGNNYSGSTAWHNSARSRLALVDGELLHEKSNMGRCIDPIKLIWTDAGVLAPGSAGRPETSDQDHDDDAAVLAAIRAATADGTDVPAARRGPSTTQHILQTFPELPGDLRGAAGRPRFWAAITRLYRAGSIAQETVATHRRHPKQCLVCADGARVSGDGVSKR